MPTPYTVTADVDMGQVTQAKITNHETNHDVV